MKISRRAFSITGLLGGLASAATASKQFVNHQVLRRPYKKIVSVLPRPNQLFDVAYVRLAEDAIVRIDIRHSGADEAMLCLTTALRGGESAMLLGVHGHRADHHTIITIESRKPFRFSYAGIMTMSPAFTRIDGMIVYHDKRFAPQVDTGIGLDEPPHHRKIYGPGKDIGYL